MQDLNVISKLNAEAHERDIPNQQAKGLYVVAEYSGLSYAGYSTHITELEANAKACEIGLEVGKRAKVYLPTRCDQDNQGLAGLSRIADTNLFAATAVSAEEKAAAAGVSAHDAE